MKTEHLILISRGELAADWVCDRDLTNWARQALTLQPEPAEVNLRLCDRLEMRRTNHRFAGNDRATNVLAFPADVPAAGFESQPQLLGDVLICAEVVDLEAQTQKKTRHQHCAHMVTHGVLHLLGYDHQDEVQAEQMEQLEVELLAALGFPDPYRK